MKRRDFLSATAAAWLATGSSARAARWRMPDESGPHRRTWMAFVARPEIWGPDLEGPVLENLASIARTVVRYEPVSMLVRPEDRARAARMCGDAVRLVECPLDDFWVRDTGPTFVLDAAGALGAVDLNFNGWGGKQEHRRDAEVAGRVAAEAGAAHVRVDVVPLETPHRIRRDFASDEFAAGYINFYVVNGAVLAPEFGDAPRDRACRDTLADLFPDRVIETLNIDVIASGGGGIHCTTQQEPLPV
ncbi:MAG: agmatine deiminase family protein [Gemmatimonadetes bacterium]|nr:agmatine deiminase family protein [Gemmatimonadota bacterium]